MPKGRASKVLKLMARLLKKQGDAGILVAQAAAQALLHSDAAIQTSALDLLAKTGHANAVQTLLVKRSPRSVLQLGPRLPNYTMVSAEFAEEEEEPGAWPAPFAPGTELTPIASIDELIAESARILNNHDDWHKYRLIVDACARLGGDLPDDIEERIGAFAKTIGIRPLGFTRAQLRKEGWERFRAKAAKDWAIDHVEFVEIGPLGSDSYSEGAETRNFRLYWDAWCFEKDRSSDRIGQSRAWHVRALWRHLLGYSTLKPLPDWPGPASTPSHALNWLSTDVLKARLATGADFVPSDLAQAFLRLGPEGRSQFADFASTDPELRAALEVERSIPVLTVNISCALGEPPHVALNVPDGIDRTHRPGLFLNFQREPDRYEYKGNLHAAAAERMLSVLPGHLDLGMGVLASSYCMDITSDNLRLKGYDECLFPRLRGAGYPDP